MSDNLRGWALTVPGKATLRTETCISCGVVFALPTHLYDELQRKKSRGTFYCPNGHTMCYAETALNDQLRAAIREGDTARQETLRIRQRIADGVCPCCTRSFANLRNHMARKHPEFGIPGDWKHSAGPFRCSCRREFDTFQGLRVHQGAQRGDEWDKPGTSRYWSHLTVV